jgi:CubicO group peptidase (beta-lactamase class C family)
VRLPTVAASCEDALATGKALGGWVYVLHEDEVVADVAFGQAAPGTAANPSDIGELRCAVKPLTTLCVAQAIETGLLGLDDTLARWAPAGTSPRIAGISIRQLLTHTSGLPNYQTPGVYTVGFDTYVAGILSARFPPPAWEAQPIYNLARGWHLLGWVLQRLYGESIQDIIAEGVTRPLGLSSMSLLDPAGLSRPYHRQTLDGDHLPIRDAEPTTFAARPNPAYGGFSTTSDLGRLYGHLLRCRREGGLVRPETIRLLLGERGGRGSVRFLPRRPQLPYGLGFFLGGGAAGFDAGWGADSFGHMGSIWAYYGTVALCSPGTGTVVAARLSSIGPANNAVLAAVGRAIHSDLGLPA